MFIKTLEYSVGNAQTHLRNRKNSTDSGGVDPILACPFLLSVSEAARDTRIQGIPI
jgi:hypothetical protein